MLFSCSVSVSVSIVCYFSWLHHCQYQILILNIQHEIAHHKLTRQTACHCRAWQYWALNDVCLDCHACQEQRRWQNETHLIKAMAHANLPLHSMAARLNNGQTTIVLSPVYNKARRKTDPDFSTQCPHSTLLFASENVGIFETNFEIVTNTDSPYRYGICDRFIVLQSLFAAIKSRKILSRDSSEIYVRASRTNFAPNVKSSSIWKINLRDKSKRKIPIEIIVI